MQINQDARKLIQKAGEAIHDINSMECPKPEPKFKLINPEDVWEVFKDMPDFFVDAPAK